MVYLDVKVYLDFEDKELKKTLKKTDYPQNINLDFCDSKDIKFDSFPKNCQCIVITDKPERIEEAKNFKGFNVCLVFVGKHAFTPELTDVWNDEDVKDTATRFNRLLVNLANEYNMWFYEHTLYSAVDTVQDIMWIKRLDGIHMLVNNAFTKMVHKNRIDIIGRDHYYIWDAPKPKPGEEDFCCADSENIAIRTGKTYIGEELVKTRHGMKQLNTYKTPLYDMFGNIYGTLGVGHDVTNFANMGIELSLLMENIPFPLVIFDSEMKLVRINASFMKAADLTAMDQVDFDYYKWKAENITGVGQETVDDIKHRVRQEIMIEREDKKFFYIMTLQEIRNLFNEISGYFLTMNDITYQRAYEETIIKEANTDTLTKMYNRRYFYHYIASNAGTPMTLLYMDLDKFKYINDTYGHAKGDEVLITAAQTIQETLKEATVARLGGDEFAAVITGESDSAFAIKCTMDVEKAIKDKFSAEGLPVGVSIGTTIYDGGELDIEKLIHESDERMYEIKKKHHEAAKDKR